MNASLARKLSVDRIKGRTEVLGPGARAVIWFHGCDRRCPGCIASSMNVSSDYESYLPEELSRRILAEKGIEGVTLSGGEPFIQDPDSMGAFLSSIRGAGLSVMAFTGYLLEEIEADKAKAPLLQFIDILVDGPYVEGEDHGEMWRGSSNQRIHYLTDRYSGLSGIVETRKGRPLEVEFGNGLDFSFTGIPPAGFRDRLMGRLHQRDFLIEF